jgi:hypothetical protein
MKPFARRTAALVTAAALSAASFPTAAFADPASGPKLTPAQELAQLKAWGVFKDDKDVMKSYIGNEKGLTKIGQALYDALKPAYNPQDAAAALQPSLDALRAKGPYNASSAQNSQKLVAKVAEQLAAINAGTGAPDGSGGSDEDQARRGALAQAALSGAAVVDPPKAGDYTQEATLYGAKLYDKNDNLAFEINEHNVTIYNRDLQKNQHVMNQHPQPGAPLVPETGRYNPETFDYTYMAIKNQYDALFDAMRRDRMMALAGLLGKAGMYKDDMWFTDKTLEPELIAEAQKKKYNSGGKTWSVYDIVENHLAGWEEEMKVSAAAVEAYNGDRKALLQALKRDPVIGNNAVNALTADQQRANVALERAWLAMSSYGVKVQKEMLDPASPDSKQLLDALNQLGLSTDQVHNYRKAGERMTARLSQVQQELDRVRAMLDKLDPSANLNASSAILAAVQTQMGDISTDYSIYVGAVSSAMSLKQQNDLGFLYKLPTAVAGWVKPGYSAATKANAAAWPQIQHVIAQISAGDMAGARKSVIAINPDAAERHFTMALGANQPSTVTDDVKIAASLKTITDNVVAVYEINKWIVTATNIVAWSVVIGLGGGIAKRGLTGFAKLCAPSAEALEGAGLVSMTRGRIVLSEMAYHTAARLSTLETKRSLEFTGKIENRTLRYLAESTVRASNAAARQATFTGMSAGISGSFVLGSHMIEDRGHWKSGKALGLQLLDPAGHSPYSDDGAGALDAFLAGAKGGAWWANESWHPALNYVGLPASAFSGTRLSGAMDVIGARGVLDSAYSGVGAMGSSVTRLAVATLGEDSAFVGGMKSIGSAMWPSAVEGGASRGLVDRLAATGKLGKAAAFPLSMADNVAKYALVGDGASWLGRHIAYDIQSRSFNVPFYGNVALGAVPDDADSVERRIKGANQIGQELAQAPIWLALPTYSAHAALEGESMMGADEGMRQYDEAGETWKYANAPAGTKLTFKTMPKTPISQRVFDFHFFRDSPSGEWTVTDAAREKGIQKEMVKAVGGDKATPADVNPLVFQRVTKMADGESFVQLKVNDEVRLAAHENFIKSLIADPARAEKILKARPGEEIPGVGRVTPEVQKDVAVALYSAEIQIGRPMPRSLAPSVDKILEPYLEANLITREPAMRLAKSLKNFTLRDEFSGDKGVLSQISDEIADWRENRAPEGVGYKDLLVELRGRAHEWEADGTVTAPEAQVLSNLFDYVDALDKRFNSFNTVDKVYPLADESLQALVEEYGSRPEPRALLKTFRDRLDGWRRGETRPGDPVVGKGSSGDFAKMITEFREKVDQSTALTPGERLAMSQAISDMEASPWAVHDAKGDAIKGWHPNQPQQFEALMGALTAFVERRPTGSVRVFQMLKTGGGKTLVAFEGLLPLVEADAHLTHKKVAFLTVQSNLEAQARMDFIAYKKIGSKLTFETYESLKTKAATGKMKGRSALRDYWILGDEIDGAAQQPALTIGQVSGRVSRLNGYFSRLLGLDTAVGDQIEGASAALGVRLQTEARRGQFAVSRLDATGADAVRDGFKSLDEAGGRLAQADGPLARLLAEDEVRGQAARVGELLGRVPAADVEALSSARDALGRIRKELDAPVDDAKFRQGVVDQFQKTLRREANLLDGTGSAEGLRRLTLGAQTRAAELQGRIDSLTSQAEAADASAVPGAANRAKALREEISLLGREKALADTFIAADAGNRLTGLQDRIAEAESEPADRRPPGLADWKREASRLRGKLGSDARDAADARADSLERQYEAGRQAGELDDAIAAAKREGRPTDALEAQRQGFESDYSTERAESARLKDALGGGSEDGDFGALLRRIETLPNEGPGSKERARLLDLAQSQVRGRFAADADQIVQIIEQGGRGWENRALRLLEQRRSLIESFAADENPFYAVFRSMNQDAQTFATGKLRSQDKADYEDAQRRFDKTIDGKNLNPWEYARLFWDTFTGRPIDVPIDRLGKTRLRAAQLLQALSREPAMPGLQGDGLFWNLLGSMVKPEGFGGRGSWVRLELKRQLDGFFEDPAGIRLDNRAGRINVVHNGQWFESMDNETRRYWELVYGTDLTLPYTHQSISTIKDLTTDKETNFIGFSGTAGEKLRKHFIDNDVKISGQGSTAPAQVNLALTDRPVDNFSRISEAVDNLNSARGRVVVPDLRDAPVEVRQAVVDRADGALPRPASLRLDDFIGSGHEADLAWLEKNGTDQGDGVVSVRSVKGAPESVRLSALDALSGRATVRLADIAEQARTAVAEKNPNAGVYERALAQLGELRAATGDADGVVLRLKADGAVPADAIPAEAKPALDKYLSDARFKNKNTTVVRISDVVGSNDRETAAARRWLLDLRKTVEVRLDAIPDSARPGLEDAVARARLKDPKAATAVVRVSQIEAGGRVTEAQAEAARDWLRTQADAQESGLMVLSVSDTRVLKMVKQYLMRVKGLQEDEIATVFSDTEYLRNNVPEAEVAKQMNLAALDDGRARVLILDTRVGGRGLDLNFKGNRGSAAPDAFRGYTNFEMLIVDPHKMSQVHLLQAEGRIDVGRVLPNADRNFSLVMDIASVANYRVFRDMVANDDFFKELRGDPRFTDFMKARGGQPDWAAYHDYVQLRVAQGGDEGAALGEEYAQVVKKALDTQQAQVEEGQLRSSSVLNDGRATTNGQFPGFELLK